MTFFFRRALALACLSMLAVQLLAAEAHADKLNRAGQRSTNGSPSSSSASSRSRGGSSLGDQLFLTLLYYSILSPFAVPYAVAKSENDIRPLPAARPFAQPGCGYYCASVEDPEQGDSEPAPSRKPVGMLLVGAEGGADLAGIPFIGVNLDASLSKPAFGIDTRLLAFREQDSGVGAYALLGKSHLTYRFAVMRRVQFRAGLGVRYFSAPHEATDTSPARGLGTTHVGIDFLYGFDIQWGRPIDTRIEFGLGNAGRAFIPEVRGTIGAWLGRTRLSLGWDQSWIGGVPLGGPLAGVGLYF